MSEYFPVPESGPREDHERMDLIIETLAQARRAQQPPDGPYENAVPLAGPIPDCVIAQLPQLDPTLQQYYALRAVYINPEVRQKARSEAAVVTGNDDVFIAVASLDFQRRHSDVSNGRGQAVWHVVYNIVEGPEFMQGERRTYIMKDVLRNDRTDTTAPRLRTTAATPEEIACTRCAEDKIDADETEDVIGYAAMITTAAIARLHPLPDGVPADFS